MRSGRAEYPERAHSPDCAGTAEGIDIEVGGDGERAHGDPGVSEVSVSEREALLGEPFLVAGVLCGYDRFGCEDDPSLCEVSREEGTSGRATQVAYIDRGPAGTTPLASSGGQLFAPLWGAKGKDRSFGPGFLLSSLLSKSHIFFRDPSYTKKL